MKEAAMPKIVITYNPDPGALHLIKTPENDKVWFRTMLDMVREEVRKLFSRPGENMPLGWVDREVRKMGEFDVFASPLNIDVVTFASVDRLASLENFKDQEFCAHLRYNFKKHFGVSLPEDPILWFNLLDERGRHL